MLHKLKKKTKPHYRQLTEIWGEGERTLNCVQFLKETFEF